ncbi:ankyrin repeat domain-containing protein [bacterium]|nr:ankyrin repeat domain-containing protein [bacterium]
MKRTLLTLAVTSLLATTGFADPIHDAARTGDLAGVQAELNKGVDVDKEELSGLTPLHYAARLVHKEIAELLIDKGANVNAVWGGRVTPLHEAAWWGRKEIAELIITAGADVNAKVSDGRTPLAMAIDQNKPETADIIRKHGGMTSAELLSGMTLLHIAVKEGKTETIELLIAKGADVNAMDRDVKTPLDWAEGTNNKGIADLLRKHGAKTGEELNVLIAAAKKGDIEAVKQHLAAGADVNAKTWDWTTPLHNAAIYGHKEVAELLIANGANMNAIIVSGRNQGKTPLDLAIWRKKNETADLLREHGGRTAEELALMPRLEYDKDQWPFGFSFTAIDGKTYLVEVTQDFKQWGELETINGTGKQFKFIDPRQPLVPFKRNFYRVKLVE